MLWPNPDVRRTWLLSQSQCVKAICHPPSVVSSRRIFLIHDKAGLERATTTNRTALKSSNSKATNIKWEEADPDWVGGGQRANSSRPGSLPWTKKGRRRSTGKIGSSYGRSWSNIMAFADIHPSHRQQVNIKLREIMVLWRNHVLTVTGSFQQTRVAAISVGGDHHGVVPAGVKVNTTIWASGRRRSFFVCRKK